MFIVRATKTLNIFYCFHIEIPSFLQFCVVTPIESYRQFFETPEEKKLRLWVSVQVRSKVVYSIAPQIFCWQYIFPKKPSHLQWNHGVDVKNLSSERLYREVIEFFNFMVLTSFWEKVDLQTWMLIVKTSICLMITHTKRQKNYWTDLNKMTG